MKKIVMCLTLALVFMTTACAAGSFWDFKKDEGESKVANRIAVFDTNMGEFEIELFEDKTPITTGNFIKLAEEGFYDDVIFHRIIERSDLFADFVHHHVGDKYQLFPVLF